MTYIDRLHQLKNSARRSLNQSTNPEQRQHRQMNYDTIVWAINRLDPRIPNHLRTSANKRHYHNTKTYSITMSPEDHDRLVALGKELHIEGGFSGVLTYIVQNCVLLHDEAKEK